jgi:competence protein CoiA
MCWLTMREVLVLYARTAGGLRVAPTPGASGACPVCEGPVIAKCGEINAWHWAHESGNDCDPWSEPLTDWHRAYQGLSPSERCEVTAGGHRADILAKDGTVVELQHSSLPVEDIRAREAHYGRSLLWVFDAREAFASGRLTLARGKDDSYVRFRWKQPRRSILECKRMVMLDLGEGLLLRIGRIHPPPKCAGWGYLYSTADFWEWVRNGTRAPRLGFSAARYENLVARIVETVDHLAPILDRSAAIRAVKSTLFPGDDPRNRMRAALAASGVGKHHTELRRYTTVRGTWLAPGYVSVSCTCGETHQGYEVGPRARDAFWEWVGTETWPLIIRCETCANALTPTITARIPIPQRWDLDRYEWLGA